MDDNLKEVTVSEYFTLRAQREKSMGQAYIDKADLGDIFSRVQATLALDRAKVNSNPSRYSIVIPYCSDQNLSIIFPDSYVNGFMHTFEKALKLLGATNIVIEENEVKFNVPEDCPLKELLDKEAKKFKARDFWERS